MNVSDPRKNSNRDAILCNNLEALRIANESQLKQKVNPFM